MFIRSIRRSSVSGLSGLALAALTLTAGLSTGEASDLFTEPRSMRVSWPDLDLSRAEGQHALYRRLRTAANVVCGDASFRSLTERAQVARCKEDAFSKSLEQIDVATASALRVASISVRSGGR